METKEKLYFCGECGGDIYASHNYCGRCGARTCRRTILEEKDHKILFFLMMFFPSIYYYVIEGGVPIVDGVNRGLLIVSGIILLFNLFVAASGLIASILLQHKRWLFRYILIVCPFIFIPFFVLSLLLLDFTPLLWAFIWGGIFFTIRREYVVLKPVVPYKSIFPPQN